MQLLLKQRINDFWTWANSGQGLHHFIHFFWAGWIVYFLNWGVLLVVAISIELHDIYIKHEQTQYKWMDHFYDLISWMLGGLVWTMLTTPYQMWLA